MKTEQLIQKILSNDFTGEFFADGENVTDLIKEALRNMQYVEEPGRYVHVHNPQNNKCIKCGVVFTTRFGGQQLCYICDKEEHDRKMKELEEKNKIEVKAETKTKKRK